LNRLYTISARLSSFDSDLCEFWFGTSHASHFYSWIFPSSGKASIGTGGQSPGMCPLLLNNFLMRHFGRNMEAMDRSKAISRYSIFPIPAWQNQSFAKGKILFLGDAAGMVMPVTYEGIYYAMKSGQYAAAAVIEDKPDSYRKLWEDRFGKRFRFMDRIKNQFFKSDRSIEKWVAMHKSSAVQELAVKLWLQKEPGNRQLLAYLKAFGSLVAP